MWTQTDFGGTFKIIHIYERYDSSNKMQIEQHWVIAQTVPYFEQQVERRNNWATTELDFLSVLRRVSWKNENAVYGLQISALVLEIFKFEKWVKYANEMTDDVIHSTQYYIKHINGAILANWQADSSPGNTTMAIKNFVLMATHSFPVLTHLISICLWFSAWKGHKLKLTYLYAFWIMHMKCC